MKKTILPMFLLIFAVGIRAQNCKDTHVDITLSTHPDVQYTITNDKFLDSLFELTVLTVCNDPRDHWELTVDSTTPADLDTGWIKINSDGIMEWQENNY